MWGRTCIPRQVYQVLVPFKRYFRCAQAQHLLVFCGLVVALIRDPGQGTLRGLGTSLPATLKYWTTLRMVRSGPWDAQALMTAMAATTLRTLPPPLDGVRSLLGDSPRKEKRGQQHPLGHTTRHREHDPYTCGFEMVRLRASGADFRLPLAVVPIDPQGRGHHNLLCRPMVKACVPPPWARQVVVVADAGLAANEPRRLLAAQNYADVLARPRPRKFTTGKPRRDLVQHRPQCYDDRRARDNPAGRRRDDWVCARRATLHHLGDVTIVRSKKRRHEGPKGVKIIVTHLTEASAGAVRSI